MTLDNEFFFPIRVYIEDTDAGGIVFYVNYLKFMERARTELLRNKGFPKPAVLDDGKLMVVVSAKVDYRKPAKLDDNLAVTAKIIKLARTYMVFEQKIFCDGFCLTEAEIKVACVNRDTMRACAFPKRLVELLS
ncbi:YbgC/FadM family acyl-CoA thioesterase [Agarilytica rhodophyticola]|uniref:YbgC/FadM family acyl-CoA thioesterase n=1 Tax=Agarilytica rhodophyticola TaxID=1737490 RepID=UPI000B341E49|nr:YbgC/FadM family acyl-CoA thioesterase [Agarilytica rhodophyticola]